jgi:hypothetical protein
MNEKRIAGAFKLRQGRNKILNPGNAKLRSSYLDGAQF